MTEQNQWSTQHRLIRSWAYAHLSAYGVDCSQYDFYVYIDTNKETAIVEALQKGSNRMIRIDRIEYAIPINEKGDWDNGLPRLMYRIHGDNR